MKHKLKKKYINKLNFLRDFCKGWPLYSILQDSNPKFSNYDNRHYKLVKKHAYTKEGRMDGTYQVFLGRKDTRWAKNILKHY